MRKKFLEKRLQRLQEKRKKLNAQVDASSDAAEVRSLTADLEDLDAEITECREELSLIEAEERAAQPVQVDEPVPAGARRVNGEVVGSFRSASADANENTLESRGYRQAFMDYVQRGTPMPAEYRSGEAINTQNTGVAIPLTVMREVINTVRKSYGNLYDKVRKLAVQGGVDFNVGELEADFHWITETTVSPDQEIGELGAVSFKYNTLEIRIAQTFLSSVVTVESFESEIATVIARAYRKAMDLAIVNGSGNGQPLGILNDTRISAAAGHTISMNATDMVDWTKWQNKVLAKIPRGYRRGGEFIFADGTVEGQLKIIADDNNRPLFVEATGLSVDESSEDGRFFGHRVSIVEPEILTDFETASTNDIIGIFWHPELYAVNENFNFTEMKYFDQNRNKWIDKALAIVDGKAINPEAFYLIKKA